MKVIHPRSLPTQLPIVDTIAWYLLLDHFTAPGWAYGVAFTVLGIIWVGAAYRVGMQDTVDIFEGKP